MGCSWLALRDAARTACGRRHAGTWRSCGVPPQAVIACLRPLRPCKSECSVRQSGRSIVVSGQTTTVSRWRLRESSLTVTHDRLGIKNLLIYHSSHLPLRLCARQSIYLGTFHNGCLTANPFILVKSFLAQRRKGAKFFRIKKSPFIWQNGISVIAISLKSRLPCVKWRPYSGASRWERVSASIWSLAVSSERRASTSADFCFWRSRMRSSMVPRQTSL